MDAYRRMEISDMGVTIDLEMAVRAYRLSVPRTEIAVIEQERLHGQTHFKDLADGEKAGPVSHRRIIPRRI